MTGIAALEAEMRDRLAAKDAEIAELKERAERAEYECERWKDVDAMRPRWDKFWVEACVKIRQLEARLAARGENPC